MITKGLHGKITLKKVYYEQGKSLVTEQNRNSNFVF